MLASAIRAFRSPLFKTPMRSFAYWGNVTAAPPDPILGVAEAFKKDSDRRKVNLGVGAYRDDNGKPLVLQCVKKAYQKIYEQNLDYEYLPIQGNENFLDSATKLAYGEEFQPVLDGKVAACQALSGTGSLRLGFEFLKKWVGTDKNIFLPEPTWSNHKNIANEAGFQFKMYRYYDPKTKMLDFNGMAEDIEKAPNEQIILLHASAHNPTGVDLSFEQWRDIENISLKKKHIVFFDMAYQGFASGDPKRDAEAVRLFARDNARILLAQSFAKNFGLYGERIGCLSVLCESKEEAERVKSQLKQIARPIWSNPPLTGARIVDTIFRDPELHQLWRKEIKQMADRINSMREALVQNLKAKGSTQDWSHITKQIGMFAYTGLNPQEVERLTTNHHIYLTKDGRISIAGLNTGNVEYVAESIANVTSKK